MNRNFDKEGRIVLPKEMRDKLNFKERDEAKIDLQGDKIIITNENAKKNQKKRAK